MGGQGNVCPARGSGWTALWTQAARDADVATSALWADLRPPVLAARVGSRDRGRSGRRQAGLSCWSRDAEHAAARGAALLFSHGHGHDRRRIVVGAESFVTNCMTSTRKDAGRLGRGSAASARQQKERRDGQGARGMRRRGQRVWRREPLLRRLDSKGVRSDAGGCCKVPSVAPGRLRLAVSVTQAAGAWRQLRSSSFDHNQTVPRPHALRPTLLHHPNCKRHVLNPRPLGLPRRSTLPARPRPPPMGQRQRLPGR